jgi:serine/threonine protein kinase
MSVTPSQAEPGAKYRLLLELGRGGMGVVQLAMTQGPQGFVKLVVLKMLKPELLSHPEAKRMFLEEARISARLSHPNLVQVYEVIEYAGVPTLVMEYLEGKPLALVADRAPLDLWSYLHVLERVLTGLHAAHELRDYDGLSLNLVHRDVSPQNVFLSFDGQVKILDFGIAKAAHSEIQTDYGELKGRIRYMAPEQLMGKDVDRRADLFAVGVILWEVLTGRRMWAGLGDAEVMRRLLEGNVPPLPSALDVPAGIVDVCRKALAPAREDRYATAQAFQRDLQARISVPPLGDPHERLCAHLKERFGEELKATHRVVQAHIEAAKHDSMGEPREWSTTLVGRRRPLHALATSRAWWIWAAVLGCVALSGVFMHFARFRISPPGEKRAVREATPKSCDAGSKWCGGRCVKLDNPETGCAGMDCTPCFVPNATARCNSQNECDIAICNSDYRDCDGDRRNGCEVEVRTDPDNCGACGNSCPPLPHADRACGDVCTLWRCDPGFRDCNELMADGCEVRTSDDPKNCGHCGQSCPNGFKCRGERCVH